MCNNKLIYLMNVPWSWLKQRPHFLAHYLSLELPVKVFYRRKFLSSNDNSTHYPDNIKGIFQLPLSRFRVVQFINDLIFKFYISRELDSSTHILFQSPHDFNVLMNQLSVNIKVIYDCMDDLIEFNSKHGDNIESIKFKENTICDRAEYIFVSSTYLRHKIIARYNCNVMPIVLNNAVDIGFIETVFSNPCKRKRGGYTEIYYIGTIAEWFDFDLIIKTLNNFNDVRVILVGASVVKLPKHERLIFRGSLPHDQISILIQQADALIMPFKITELVKSVNPVKLYEYIATSVPIITCDYDEINVFEDFVYRYTSDNEFIGLINKLLNNDLIVRGEQERKNFLVSNTWGNRAKQMSLILRNCD
jgi:teichuronic acid biosynthesis glycosyltransferase TuaH